MNIKPAINDFYIETLNDMIRVIEMSEAGKRMWTICEVTGRCDYSLTKRSTYPNWCKFYYVRTPKRERIKYILDDARKPFEDGYFNGATKDLIGIFEMYKKGYVSKSKRVQIIFENCIDGYFDELREIEYLNAQYDDGASFEYVSNIEDLDDSQIPF